MGHFLSEPKLTEVRTALSDAFNDSPVDYDHIAKKIKDVDPRMAYDILYSEVAPVCFTNIAAAVPPVWTGFDPDSLNAMIEERLAARQNSWFRRQFDKVLVAWLKYNYSDIWKDIARRL
ncbi:MAG: DUF7079 family protein [Pseudomonadales bacterium]